MKLQVTDLGSIADFKEGKWLSEKSGWRTVAVLFIFYVFAMIDRQVMNMTASSVQNDMGITDVEVSMLLGLSFALFYTTFGLAMGWLTDRYSRRLIIAISVSLWGLACAACGIARNFEELFVARLLVGVGEAALGPAAFSMIADAFSRRKLALALSVYTTGGLVGGAIAVSISGLVVEVGLQQGGMVLPLIGEVEAWRLAFLFTGLPGPLLALLAFTVAEPKRDTVTAIATMARGKRGFLQFIVDNRALLVCLFVGFGAMNMILNCVFVWSPTYLDRQFELTHIQIGLIIASLLLISAVPGQVFVGWIVDKMVRNGRNDAYLRYFIITLPIAGVSGMAAFMADGAYGFWVGMVPLYFVCLAFMGIASTAIQITTPPEYRGRMSAVFIMVTTLIGLGIGPTLVAAVATSIDPEGSALGTALAIVVAGATVIAMVGLRSGQKSFCLALARADAELGNRL